MRVYILTDLEGVAGVASFRDDAYPDGRHYARARTLLTAELNAAAQGCLAGGATEIVAWDGHGVGGVNPDELHPDIRLVHGEGAPPNLLMDRGFDVALFVGQHAMQNAKGGNLAHSYSDQNIREMRLNDVPVGEFGLRTYLAGCFQIPVVMLTGDQAACEEAKALVPGVMTVAVKEGISRTLALSVSPVRARTMIEDAARRAMAMTGTVDPLPPPPPPYALQICYSSVDLAERAAQRPHTRRVDATTVVIESPNFLDIAM